MNKVLIVDGNSTTRELYAKKLRRAGFEVDEAESASQGWEMLSRTGTHRYQVVITDLGFTLTAQSKMGGLELAEKIRQKYESTQVIIVTGGSSEGYAIAALKLRVFDYFVKGASSLPDELVKATRKAAEESERRTFMSNHQEKGMIDVTNKEVFMTIIKNGEVKESRFIKLSSAKKIRDTIPLDGVVFILSIPTDEPDGEFNEEIYIDRMIHLYTLGDSLSLN